MLSATKYCDSSYDYNDEFRFRELVNPPQFPIVFFPQTEEEFRLFSVHENAFSVALFIHTKDHRANVLISMMCHIASSLHKAVIVDVEKMPGLAQSYRVSKPSIMKIFKQNIIESFANDVCTLQTLYNFVNTKTSSRFRRVESR
jgi:hypothetical protein